MTRVVKRQLDVRGRAGFVAAAENGVSAALKHRVSLDDAPLEIGHAYKVARDTGRQSVSLADGTCVVQRENMTMTVDRQRTLLVMEVPLSVASSLRRPLREELHLF